MCLKTCTSCYFKKPCVKSNFPDKLPSWSPFISNCIKNTIYKKLQSFPGKFLSRPRPKNSTAVDKKVLEGILITRLRK